MDFIQVLFWAGIGSVFSLVGGLVLVGASTLRERIIRYALPFGAGALLGAAFLGVLPEALEGRSDAMVILAYALAGFLGFFVLERLLSWFHHHPHHHHRRALAEKARNKTHIYLVVIGDTLHNAIDGVAIGAAFLVDPTVGVATAIAVAAHEIPQEVGDFGILLGKGMRPRRVIAVNLFSALATLVTASTTYLLGSAAQIDAAPLLAVAAGFFVYIAASDIIPDIHERPRREGNRQAAMLFIGVLVIALTTLLLPHSHAHEPVDAHGHERMHDDHEQGEHSHGDHDHDHSHDH